MILVSAAQQTTAVTPRDVSTSPLQPRMRKVGTERKLLKVLLLSFGASSSRFSSGVKVLVGVVFLVQFFKVSFVKKRFKFKKIKIRIAKSCLHHFFFVIAMDSK